MRARHDTLVPLDVQTKAVVSMAGVSRNVVLDAKCVSANPNNHWKCIFGAYRMPFVKTRYT